ncbi:MAG: RIP metalloprotease RseP [Chloroflexota bacterium]|nr:RIP metalloprotease RseP [Chloroflexota bacterium]
MNLSWLWVVPVLGVLIIVHEMGHFFTAIWLGIKVEEFGIGFPPRIFAIRRRGIDYSLNALPIGGFVKITGENGDSDDPHSFGRAPAWKRIIVLAAGSFMNLLLAIIIFAVTSVSGTQEVDAPTTGVGAVLPNQAAYVAGMQTGDRIVSIAGHPVNSSDDIRTFSKQNIGKPTSFVVERDGHQMPLTVTPGNSDAPLGVQLSNWVDQAKVAQIAAGSSAAKAGLKNGDVIVEVNGTAVANFLKVTDLLTHSTVDPAKVVVMRNGQRVGPFAISSSKSTSVGKQYDLAFELPHHMVYYSPSQALGKSLHDTWDVIGSIPRGMADAVAGKAQGAGVTGIVGISQITGEVAQEAGFTGLLRLTALLGISLFMINLLPLPALDGGRLLFILIELVRGGRRIAPEKEGMVHFAGMVVLLGLMALITFFDINRIFEGRNILGP